MTGETITSVDNCTFRSFVKRQILLDSKPATTQPAVMQTMFEPIPTTQPSTKPAAMVEGPTTRPATVAVIPTTRPTEPSPQLTGRTEVYLLPSDPVTAPATQPSDNTMLEPDPAITELPFDEVAK